MSTDERNRNQPVPAGRDGGSGSGGGEAELPAIANGPPDEPRMMPPMRDRGPRWFGLGVIIVAFGLVGGWAATAPIDSAVVAQGTVTVDSYRQQVQHLEGGIVQSILVSDGDEVSEGELLIQLDETQARAMYLMNQNRLLSELAREARLRAEMTGADEIAFPDRLVQRADDNERVQALMETEQRQFDTRRAALQGEVEVLRQRISQLEEQVRGLEAQRAARLRAIESFEEELASKERLAERDLIPSAELRPIERQLADNEGEAGELLASIGSTRVEIGETELQIIQREREFQREVSHELRETSDTISSLEEELHALEDTLQRKQIRAPVAGEVMNRQVHAEWAVIGPGDAILDIVPADEPLIVEARVRPEDIDSMALGMGADVRFTAFSFRTTPVVRGIVVQVSADRLEDERTGEPYYLARVAVPDDELAELGDVSLRAGMPAEVMINTGERTPLAYLMKPLTDAIVRSFRED